jgi:hypothetical protein
MPLILDPGARDWLSWLSAAAAALSYARLLPKALLD